MIPLLEVAGKAAGVAPIQYGPRAVNVGVVLVLTTTDMVVVAQEPPVEVKVYTVVPAAVVLIVEGLHVPVMPLVEVVGSTPGLSPTQYGPSCVNKGIVPVLTTTDMVAVVPHEPAVGVKVYTVVPADAVLIVAGFHVPVMPFVDVVDREAGIAPMQYGPSCVNVGVILADIVTLTSHVDVQPCAVVTITR